LNPFMEVRILPPQPYAFAVDDGPGQIAVRPCCRDGRSSRTRQFWASSVTVNSRIVSYPISPTGVPVSAGESGGRHPLYPRLGGNS
jgi:hypothetical protein